MPLIALLDSQFALKGFETVKDPEPDSQYRINVPDDCDNAVGKYFWDHTRGRFIPITDPLEKERVRGEINFVKAIYRALEALDKGQPLPKITKDWMADYKVSMDNKD